MVSVRARAGHDTLWRAGFVVGALLLCSGCGYTFAAAPGILGFTSGKSVRVEPFSNLSLQQDAASVATRAAARALAERGATVAEHPGTLVLTGTIDSVNPAPTGLGTWRVDARMHVVLKDPAQGDKVVAHAVLFDVEPYLSGDDIEGAEASRRVATNRLLERMTANALDRMTP